MSAKRPKPHGMTEYIGIHFLMCLPFISAILVASGYTLVLDLVEGKL